MSVTRDGDRNKQVTLAFELAAFERLTHPNEVIADARTWSRYVGLISNDTDAVESYVETHGLRQDFDLGDRDKWLALSELHDATDTARHVFVGLSEDDERAAAYTGWEFVPLTEAAEKAGWSLDEETDHTTGVIDRFRGRLPERLQWPW